LSNRGLRILQANHKLMNNDALPYRELQQDGIHSF